MEIKDYRQISEAWHKGFARKTDDINEVVVHGTGGGTNGKVFLNWMATQGRPDEYSRGIGLFHFLIDTDGTVYQTAHLDRWYYHSSSGQHDKQTIGIELLNSNQNNEAEYTSFQYKALVELLSDLFRSYKITDIVSHNFNKYKYSNGNKNCPGNFDWDHLHDVLSCAFSNLIYEKEHIYNFV